MGKLVRRARAEGIDPAVLVDAAEAQMWRAAGLDADDSHPLLEELDADVFAEPHALGWLHQFLAEEARQRSFELHTSAEAKHTSAVTTTQLYTPRWVADWLAERCLDVAGGEVESVLDPACGGGQMLLAAVAAMGSGSEAFSRIRGIDLDPTAVDVCRRTLKIAAARAQGGRDPDVEAAIDRNVVVGDGLSEEIQPATVVLTNPPYMGSRSMPADLKARLKKRRPFHLDLYLAFIRQCARLAERATGVLAQQTVWYLKRFEKARRWMLQQGRVTDFAHLGHGVFEALSGEKATVVAFVWEPDGEGSTRFHDLRGAADKRGALLQSSPREMDAARLEALPASPMAFWLPDVLLDSFADGPRLADVAEVPGSQNKTGKNAKYVRAAADVDPDDPRWVPYSKGGRFAPWWGNWDWVVDWSDEARAFYASNPTSNLLAEEYWFREGLCYSDFGGKSFNARWMPPGCVFDMAGPAIFVDEDDRDLLAALLVVLNSTVAREVFNALNPTLHFQVRDVRNLPLPRWDDATVARFADHGHQLVASTREALRSGTLADELLAQEFVADRLVAEAYGCRGRVVPTAERRIHHRLKP
jgi:methylase of polypeptide subunit release factors